VYVSVRQRAQTSDRVGNSHEWVVMGMLPDAERGGRGLVVPF